MSILNFFESASLLFIINCFNRFFVLIHIKSFFTFHLSCCIYCVPNWWFNLLLILLINFLVDVWQNKRLFVICFKIYVRWYRYGWIGRCSLVLYPVRSNFPCYLSIWLFKSLIIVLILTLLTLSIIILLMKNMIVWWIVYFLVGFNWILILAAVVLLLLVKIIKTAVSCGQVDTVASYWILFYFWDVHSSTI